MPDVTFREIDEMDGIHDGVARRARAELGVTDWGMQVFTLPANWDGYPEHKHDAEALDPNQEEVDIPLEGLPGSSRTKRSTHCGPEREAGGDSRPGGRRPLAVGQINRLNRRCSDRSGGAPLRRAPAIAPRAEGRRGRPRVSGAPVRALHRE